MLHVLLIALLLTLWSLPAQAVQRGEIYRHAKAATVLIAAIDDRNHSVSLGSGFFVNPDGLLVTNAHVIEEQMRLIVYAQSGPIYSSPEVIAIDRDLDLAALQIRQAGMPALALAPRLPEEGMEGIAVGYPRLPDILQMGFTLHATAMPQTVSGIVAGRSRTKGNPAIFIQTTGTLHYGNSGGPLVDPNSGDVVGMVVQTVPYLERANDRDGTPIGNVMLRADISYSIPSSMIRDWLASHTLVAESTPSPPHGERSSGPADYPIRQPVLEAAHFFATAHLLHTIAIQLDHDQELLSLAVSYYQAATALQPDALGVLRNLRLAYASLGQWDKALQAHLAVLDDNPEAILEFRKTLDYETASLNAVYNPNPALEATGLREGALTAWEPFLRKTGILSESNGKSLEPMPAAVVARLQSLNAFSNPVLTDIP